MSDALLHSLDENFRDDPRCGSKAHYTKRVIEAASVGIQVRVFSPKAW